MTIQPAFWEPSPYPLAGKTGLKPPSGQDLSIGALPADLKQIAPDLYCFQDTCNVYILRSKDEAVLIDFGAGGVIDRLDELGVRRVGAVLMTHHHRDQGQGLERAAAEDIPIWVPHTEQDLFQEVEAHWQARPIYNDYNVRQDRFTLLEPVPVAGTLRDYAGYEFAGHRFTILPTPGHTPGSISLALELGGQSIVFTGDLIAAPGKVWSLAATQWTYNGAEGAAASIAALLDLQDRQPNLLLPAHGSPMHEPGPAIELLVGRLRQVLDLRGENLHLSSLRQDPYESITPHLLRNRTSTSNSYVLLSESHKALLIDYGYDFMTGFAAGTDRASRRPWLYTLPALKRAYGVERIDVAIPTHYHDDHVAGINLLRDVEGTQVWAAESFSEILEHPGDHDLPCLWYDPIPVDRRLPLGEPFRWEEYELTLYPLPGHTLYAVAVVFEVDGVRVLATGDQYQNGDGLKWNYVYRNQFGIDDYVASAALYQSLSPDLILPGHWNPLWVQPGYFDALAESGAALASLHRALLPLEDVDLGAEGFAARLRPYQAVVTAGDRLAFEVKFCNPFHQPERIRVQIVAPPDWQVEGGEFQLEMQASATHTRQFWVTPPAGVQARRVRLAADLTAGSHRLGQQAEALVTVLPPAPTQPVEQASIPSWLTDRAGMPVPVVPVLDQDFPDPGVLRVDGFYYGFATNACHQHIRAARSTDLLHWETLQDALPELPAWAVPGFQYTWAPAVLPAPGGGYRMYFVTRYAAGTKGVQAIGVATSRSPDGPFQADSAAPLVCQLDEGGSIDPYPFCDADGLLYLAWKNDGNACGAPTWIYLQRLALDGLSLAGEPARLLTADLPWEGGLVEAPTIWKNNGRYYLFYSANNFTTPRYAIGYAVSDHLWGPYYKSSAPWLVSSPQAGLVGPGGQDIVIGPDGQTWMLFHAWSPGKYRALHAAPVEWVAGRPHLRPTP